MVSHQEQIWDVAQAGAARCRRKAFRLGDSDHCGKQIIDIKNYVPVGKTLSDGRETKAGRAQAIQAIALM